jgi:hypothetical protein
VNTSFDLDVSATSGKAGWTVTATPRALDDLDVSVGNGKQKAQYAAIDGQLRSWLSDKLLSRVKPVKVAQFSAEDLPLRAVSILPDAKRVRIALLTDSGVVDAPLDGVVKLTDGFQLDIAQASLTAMARRAAFEKGVLTHDVVADPRELSIKRGTFELQLRLWRIKGRGWWRDYTVTGTFTHDKGRLMLAPTEVEETGQSAGAVFVDPLAALAEGLILDGMAKAMETSVPTTSSQDVAGAPLTVRIDTAWGAGALVTLRGSLDAGAAKKPGKPSKKPADIPRRR